ncbi:MAG: phospholipase D-like domain-containing protein [Methylacidiphilaceae bacterium]|nr:phospholipase D-like domain-containing protein [Candidatus Methylacidiphilaceae bacterium]
MRTGLAGLAVLSLVLAGCARAPKIPLGGDPPGDRPPGQEMLDGGGGPSLAAPGNRVSLVSSGPKALEALFAAMEGARDHINLEFYILENVRVHGRSLDQLLARKLRSGVAVNLILDGYGSHRTDPAFLERLRREGARIVFFHPVGVAEILRLDRINDRDHRKILVVDGRVGWIGGINIARTYESDADAAASTGDRPRLRWDDVAARIEGPAVAELQRLFFATWSAEHGPAVEKRSYYPELAKAGRERVRVIGSGPGRNLALFYGGLLERMHAARRSIDLCTGSFVPTRQMVEELARAGRRGVAVRLVLPSVLYHPEVEMAGSADYPELLRAGVRIWEMPEEVLHTKLAAIDEDWTAVGSSNLDERSVLFNQEVDTIVWGRRPASAARAIVEAEISRCREITLPEWRRRALLERMNEFFSVLWRFLL